MFAIGLGSIFRVSSQSCHLRTSNLGGPTLSEHDIISSPTGLSPSKMPRSRGLRFDIAVSASTTSLTPFRAEIQFALFPFRSRLVGESLLFSFPTGTKMFQFPASIALSGFSCENVFALGDPGFNARMRLAQAYRSLPRPSSRPKPSYPSISFSKIKLFPYSHCY